MAARAYEVSHGSQAWQEGGTPADLPARRWSVPWRAAVGAALVLVVVGVTVVLRSLPGGPEVLVSTAQASTGVGAVDEETGQSLVDGGSTPTAPSRVTVHVVGAVVAPGVVVLAPGARAIDAVQAAGGATPVADLARVNLARVLSDGEQLVVPAVGEQVQGLAVAGQGAEGDGVLDLNTADAAALEELPRIGPVLAGRIVDWRTAHGRFSSVDELGEVPGIGPALLAGLEGLVRV